MGGGAMMERCVSLIGKFVVFMPALAASSCGARGDGAAVTRSAVIETIGPGPTRPANHECRVYRKPIQSGSPTGHWFMCCRDDASTECDADHTFQASSDVNYCSRMFLGGN